MRAASSAQVHQPVLPRLEVAGLGKRLGQKLAVDGVDLTVQDGESVVLLGPSGCGKTTTLRMIAGFIKPDRGEIRLSGRLVSGRNVFVPPEGRQLGMVFQSYALWPHKTVHENIAFPLTISGVDKTTIRRKVEHILDLVHLPDLEKRFPSELSGGQQQRVALARAIIAEPGLLLLDEPLSNLDAGLRQDLRSELKKLHRRTGMTMLYVTHDQEEALVLADRIALVHEGRIEQFADPETVYRRPKSRFAASFVGTSNLIDGIVRGKDETQALIEIETRFGVVLQSKATIDAIERARLGDKLTMVVRPEDIAVTAPAPGRLAGLIVEASFLGRYWELEIKIGEEVLNVHTHRLDAAVDGRVGLSFDPAAAWVVT